MNNLTLDRATSLAALAEGTFDLLVVGGGITGAGVAREASLRGFRVGLVEQLDFASGTSSRSTKLIHGGLRYLKQLDFMLVAEAVHERQLLLRMAPHLVEAMPFVFPVYRGDPDGLLALRAGLVVYDLFARMRAAVPHRILSPQALLEREPGLRAEGLVGGAVYTDSRTDDARLTLAVLESAARHGAAIANYVAVEAFVHLADGRLAGARVHDTLTGQRLEVRASRILAAAGPWADAIRRLDDPSAPPILRLTKGVHVTVAQDRLPLRHAVDMRSHDRERRLMFAIPRGHFTYLGTTDTEYAGDLDTIDADHADVRYILDAANGWFPGARLREDDVVSTWAGVRPLIRPARNARPSAVSRDYQLFRSRSGLVTVGGGKLTAFRAMADHIVSQLLPGSGGQRARAASVAPLPGADQPLLAESSADRGLDWHRAMTRYAVEREMAQHLEDVYRRRTDLMLFSRDNGRAWLRPLVEEMARLLDWSPERTTDEVRQTQAAIDAMFAFRTHTAVALAGRESSRASDA